MAAMSPPKAATPGSGGRHCARLRLVHQDVDSVVRPLYVPVQEHGGGFKESASQRSHTGGAKRRLTIPVVLQRAEGRPVGGRRALQEYQDGKFGA